jgi:transcriptional regulator with XRE-family HTH domain
MLQKRLKQVRLARGLSLEGLSERMGGVVTKQALSKYEKGLMVPSIHVLTKIAEALEIKTAYLWTEPSVRVELTSYRRHSALLKREQESIESIVSQTMEDRVRLQEIVQGPVAVNLPRRYVKVRSLEDAESTAETLRKSWNLGEAPIASVTGTLEEQLIHVITIDNAGEKFDGIAAKVTDEKGEVKAAAVVTRGGLPGERQRLNLLHELGHLVMDVQPSINEEKAAFRFAGAFLAPASLVFREIGRKRSTVQLQELIILKKFFGMSIQALLYRMYDLEIINKSLYTHACIQINKLGFKKSEPEPMPPEEPRWLKLTVLRAFSEGLLTKEDAERLIGKPQREASRQIMNRRAFMELSLKDRRQVLKDQAAALADHYSRDIETKDIGGGDFIEH